VEKIMPPTTAVPSGRRDSPPAPRPSASGRMPKMVASVVMRIGRRRMRAAPTTASTSSMPRARRWFANSTTRIAFLVTSPISMMRPICEKMLSVSPPMGKWSSAPTIAPKRRVKSAPNTASGTENRIVSGWTKLSNWAASTR
jgi:hypothetical protein